MPSCQPKYARAHDLKLSGGKVCIISNFIVKPHKEEDKYRPVQNVKHLILSLDTKIKEVQETLMEFPN